MIFPGERGLNTTQIKCRSKQRGQIMKMNKQVTDVEHILSDTDSIVSNTDLKGVITYVNDTFKSVVRVHCSK